MIRFFGAALFLLSATSSAAWAKLAPGSTGANFLRIGVGARPVAMGEAFTGVSDDVHAMFYNPAGLGMLDKQELMLMHNSFIGGVRQEIAGYALPTKHFGTLGLGANLVKVSEFDSFDTLDRKIGTVDADDMAASVSYAREIGSLRRVSIGATARHVRSRLDSYTASATMFDGGIMARYGLEGPYETRYRLGGALRNIGQPQKFVEEAFQLPQSLHIGGSRSAPLPHPFEDMRLNLALESVVPNDDIPYFALGAEVQVVHEFAIRLGYRTNQDIGLGLSIGFGFRSMHRGFLPKWVPEVSMDYALVDFGKLEQAHRIGFSMKFGKDKHGRDEFESLFDPTQY